MSDLKSTGSRIKERLLAKQNAEFSEMPSFPRVLNVELNNVCNHSCNFCAYSLMERERGNIETQRLEQWLREAYELGARDLGLHSGAEPFASKQLEHFISFSKKVGYEYVYISTNGSLATPRRMKAVIDAGIDSIKFSINAGDRETYRRIHGKDQFDLVVDHVRFAARYRGTNSRPYLSISFVITEENRHTLEKIVTIAKPLVDEFIAFPAANQSGQLSGSGEKAKSGICHTPFNKLHISWEGFLRGCCNDYENLLAIEDLNSGVSLEEAYYGGRYRQWRRQHLEGKLDGTLCFNCVHDCKTPVQPLYSDLYFRSHKTEKGPKVSHTPIIFRK